MRRLVAMAAAAAYAMSAAPAAAAVGSLRSEGWFTAPFGSQSFIQAVAYDGHGRLYFADTREHVAVTDLEGHVLMRWNLTPEANPPWNSGIAVDIAARGPEGEVAVARPDLGQVERYAADGTPLDVLHGPWTGEPEAVAYTPGGELLVRAGFGLWRHGTSGAAAFLGSAGPGVRVAPSTDGGAWVTLDDHVGKLRDGRLVAEPGLGAGGFDRGTFPRGGFSRPAEIAPRPHGGAWALDSGLSAIDGRGRVVLECAVPGTRHGGPGPMTVAGRTLLVLTGRRVQRLRMTGHRGAGGCARPPLRFERLGLVRPRPGAVPTALRYHLTRPARLHIRLDGGPHDSREATVAVGRHGTVALTRRLRHVRPGGEYALRIWAVRRRDIALANYRTFHFVAPQ